MMLRVFSLGSYLNGKREFLRKTTKLSKYFVFFDVNKQILDGQKNLKISTSFLMVKKKSKIVKKFNTMFFINFSSSSDRKNSKHNYRKNFKFINFKFILKRYLKFSLITEIFNFSKNFFLTFEVQILTKILGKWVPLCCTLRGGVDLGLGLIKFECNDRYHCIRKTILNGDDLSLFEAKLMENLVLNFLTLDINTNNFMNFELQNNLQIFMILTNFCQNLNFKC
ncbi:hypothetical protein AGLY_006919 [Aphis glycines]|uniref:Uncharacterized protein n=1 Tax=Aphis glycines TaxID=307491 RepID=A0A6G0TQX5_APHGL|nr:hypothetical protein AGLY_006919 [Aphis glycines]